MDDRRRILYFHGFASSPKSRKVTGLARLLAPSGIELEAPDLNVPSFETLSFAAMVGVGRQAARMHPPDLLAGSSLGAIVALALAREISAPLVLIAPALGFGKRWTANLKPGDPLLFFHHSEGREIPIHRAFFEEMARLDVDRDPPPTPVTILMGRRDESVPFEVVEEVWHAWQSSRRLAGHSRFVEIPGGDHSLTDHVERIAAEIRYRLG
jgi:predicted esterase YcpF (UPF0227 family)